MSRSPSRLTRRPRRRASATAMQDRTGRQRRGQRSRTTARAALAEVVEPATQLHARANTRARSSPTPLGGACTVVRCAPMRARCSSLSGAPAAATLLAGARTRSSSPVVPLSACLFHHARLLAPRTHTHTHTHARAHAHAASRHRRHRLSSDFRLLRRAATRKPDADVSRRLAAAKKTPRRFLAGPPGSSQVTGPDGNRRRIAASHPPPLLPPSHLVSCFLAHGVHGPPSSLRVNFGRDAPLPPHELFYLRTCSYADRSADSTMNPSRSSGIYSTIVSSADDNVDRCINALTDT